MDVPQYLYLRGIYKVTKMKNQLMTMKVSEEDRRVMKKVAQRFYDGNVSEMIRELVTEKYHETFKSV